MRHGGLLLVVLAGAMAATLGVRAVRHAGAPVFELGLDLPRRPDLHFRGLESQCATDRGEVVVRAQEAAPGHEHWGQLALGPSTHLALRGVEVRVERAERGEVVLQAELGRLRGDRVELDGQVRLRAPNGRERQVADVVVDLRSGAVGRR